MQNIIDTRPIIPDSEWEGMRDGIRSNESVSRVIPREIPCWIETTENFAVRPRTSEGHRLFAGNRSR